MHTISSQTFFVWAFEIVVDSWKFPMLLLYILWDDWPIFMISGSKEQLQQQLEYTWLSQPVNFKNAIWHFRRTIYNKILFYTWKKCPHRNVWNASDCFSTDHLVWIEHQFLSGIRDSRKPGSLWGLMRGVEGVRKSIHHSWLAKGWGLGLLCWGFKDFRKRFCRKRPALFKWVSGISSRTIHQSTTPSLSLTIWPRWASRQFLSLPIVKTLLPVTFGYSLSSEAVVMRQLRR